MSENASVTANLGPQHLGAARDTVAQVLEEAKRQGASAAEAQLSLAQGLSVDVRLGEVETVEFHRDRGLAVTVFFGQRKGQASTSDDSPQSLRDAVAAACAIGWPVCRAAAPVINAQPSWMLMVRAQVSARASW